MSLDSADMQAGICLSSITDGLFEKMTDNWKARCAPASGYCSTILFLSFLHRLSLIIHPSTQNPKEFGCKNCCKKRNPKNITLGLLGVCDAIPTWDKCCKLLKRHLKVRSVKLFKRNNRLSRRVHMKREKVGLLSRKTWLSHCWML